MSENETEIKKGSAVKAFSNSSILLGLGVVATSYAVNHLTAGNWGWLVVNTAIAVGGFYGYRKQAKEGREIVNRMEQKLDL